MDSRKVGSGISPALTGQSGIKKSANIESDKEVLNLKRSEEKSDFNVAFSDKAREIAEARAKALEIAKNTPDIRENLVSDLKRRIASGEYKVEPENIADGMLREAIRDELSKNPL